VCSASSFTAVYLFTQQSGKSPDLRKIWKMDEFSTVREDLLAYILSVELAAEK
jgi:hypothetical protein